MTDKKDDHGRFSLPPRLRRAESLFPSPASTEFKAEADRVEQRIRQFVKKYKGKISQQTDAGFALALKSFEEIARDLDLLLSYVVGVGQKEADPVFLSTQKKRHEEARQALSFFASEISRMDETDFLDRLSSPDVHGFLPWLRQVRAWRPYRLTEEMEGYLLQKSEVAEKTWEKLFDMISTEGAAGGEGQMRLLALVLNTRIELKRQEDEWRELEDVLKSAALASQTDLKSIRLMMSSVEEALPDLAHRFYAWKAKGAGVSRLAFSALSLSNEKGAEQKDLSFVEEAFPGLQPLLSALLSEKEDMSARRTGMALHHALAIEAQPFLSSSVPETWAAATGAFFEAIAFDERKKKIKNIEDHRTHLIGRVQDLLERIVRPSALHAFEERIHLRRREKGELSLSSVNELWLEAQKEFLGSSVKLDGAETAWAGHRQLIAAPFSAYGSAYAEILGLVLFDFYRRAPDKEDFARRYIDMLKSGNRKSPEALLREFGIDISSPVIWQRGIEVLKKTVAETVATAPRSDHIVRVQKEFSEAKEDVVAPDHRKGAPPQPPKDAGPSP